MKLFKKGDFIIVSLFLIITTTLLGGCNVDISVDKEDTTKAKNADEQKLLNSRAMKDDFTSQFLSINPKEKDYLTFTSKTKGYKILFYKDAIVDDFRERDNTNSESITVSFEDKPDNLKIYQDMTYFDSEFSRKDGDEMVEEMKEILNKEEIKHFEDDEKECYIMHDKKGTYSLFFAVIYSKKHDTKAVELHGHGKCLDAEKTCNKDERIEKHFNKIIRSFEF
ncbi:hypothetical protein [Rummeliibacillus sp. SL167]|uniref:hypothetical protein n=1 Tax=Rummeliibacillus sp. SL167 TaxID=2579792 RepID=UPI0011B52AA6|nr:hypothetical protein [Rummeliibacillus sp. SL167]